MDKLETNAPELIIRIKTFNAYMLDRWFISFYRFERGHGKQKRVVFEFTIDSRVEGERSMPSKKGWSTYKKASQAARKLIRALQYIYATIETEDDS